MEAPAYSVVGSLQRVDARSAIRLPFEPKGWLLDFRKELRTSLRAMRTADASVLLAEYATPDEDFADLENVLLYNVGSGSYSHLTRRGMICRRVQSADEFHRVSYTVTDRTEWPEFAGRLLATASLDEPARGHTPLPWWSALRQRFRVQSDLLHQRQFAITVELGVGWHRGQLSSMLKPILDGLVSALHVHDGSSRERITTALGETGDGGRLWSLLNDPTIAILGQRRLVRPHGSGIAWNPADELCGSFRVIRSLREEAVAVAVLAIEDVIVPSTRSALSRARDS